MMTGAIIARRCRRVLFLPFLWWIEEPMSQKRDMGHPSVLRVRGWVPVAPVEMVGSCEGEKKAGPSVQALRRKLLRRTLSKGLRVIHSEWLAPLLQKV